MKNRFDYYVKYKDFRIPINFPETSPSNMILFELKGESKRSVT